jgi:hypothetical protein
MPELIHEPSALVSDESTTYAVRVYADERAEGTWEGWLEFRPLNSNKPPLRTGQETSQPNRDTIEYWALGLEPIYFEGALARAQGRLL